MSYIRRLLTETGLFSLLNSSRDSKLICLQRFVRLFAYGASSLILALYLQLLGNPESHVGLFMTLTMLGDVVISLVLTLFADSLGKKNILMLGSVLMVASGLVFAFFVNLWVLLVAAIFGVISPGGTEIGPFRAVEESTLAQLSSNETRSDIYAWYTLIGTAGTALGSMVSGWLIERLEKGKGWQTVDAYRVVFILYAGIGIVKLSLAFSLSRAIEYEPRQQNKGLQTRQQDAPTEDTDPERPLLEEHNGSSGTTPQAVDGPKKSRLGALVPRISPASRKIVAKLSTLFAIDSFASGLVPVSWMAVFFTSKFSMAAGPIGTLIFVTSLIAAASNLVSASIARHIGLLRTMVFTHLPSTVFLALIPAPSSKWLAMAFLALRCCTSTMDTAPRQAFLAAAVLNEERTAIMGAVNVIKTLAQSAGPAATGGFASRGRIWISFVLAGALKATYDLSMLAMFWSFTGRVEE